MTQFNDQWRLERDRKRLEREMKQFQQRMSTPVLRGEVYQMGEQQVQHIASLALAIEALEQLLVERDVLKADELMNRMKSIADSKAEQVAAADAAQKSSSNLIQSTEA